MIDEKKLEQLDSVKREYQRLDQVVSNLKHYTSEVGDGGGGTPLKKKTKRLFPLLEFLFSNKEEVIIKPHSIYSSVDISPGMWSSTELSVAMSDIQHELMALAIDRVGALRDKKEGELAELLK